MTDYERAAAKYRPIFDRIAAGALKREQDRELPYNQISWLKDAGFGAARVPAEFGGDGLTWPQFTRLLIELAAADSNIAQILRGHIALVEENLYHHQRHDRSVWFKRFVAGEIAGNAWTEPGKGGTSTVLEESNGVLSLTGRKYYTTGTIFADWVDVTAQRPDGSDVSAIVSTKTASVVTFDDWDGFGQRLTGSGTTVFDRAPVDRDNVFAFETRFPYQTALYQHILLVVLTGIGKAAELEVVQQVRGRERAFSHGSASLVRHDPQVLQVVGEISAKVYAAESTTLRAAEALEAAYQARLLGGAAEKEANVAAELATAQAQVVLSSLIPEAAGAIFNVLGASSTSAGKGLDRHWRNARTAATHNPSIYKARIVGDWAVNAKLPPFIWSIGVAGTDASPTDDSSGGRDAASV